MTRSLVLHTSTMRQRGRGSSCRRRRGGPGRSDERTPRGDRRDQGHEDVRSLALASGHRGPERSGRAGRPRSRGRRRRDSQGLTLPSRRTSHVDARRPVMLVTVVRLRSRRGRCERKSRGWRARSFRAAGSHRRCAVRGDAGRTGARRMSGVVHVGGVTAASLVSQRPRSPGPVPAMPAPPKRPLPTARVARRGRPSAGTPRPSHRRGSPGRGTPGPAQPCAATRNRSSWQAVAKKACHGSRSVHRASVSAAGKGYGRTGT